VQVEHASKAIMDMLKKVEHSVKMSVRVPGSSANLGAGFDTCALALTCYADMTMVLMDKPDETIPFLCIEGDTSPTWQIAENFLFQIMSQRIDDKKLLDRIRVLIKSDIPVGKGLGSSAAVVAGGLWLCKRLAEEEATPQYLLDEGTTIEGHPDNIGASILGGFVVGARSARNGKVYIQKIEWPKNWCPILVEPDRPLQTSKARAVLPGVMPRADVVFNLQHAGLLVAAVQNQDEDLMLEALDDRIHEPYRSKLLPELPSLKKLLKDGPAMGCVLSGAGSSILVLCTEANKAKTIERLEDWSQSFKLQGSIRELKVDSKGLQVLND
jgi:homoserine kinase